MNEYSAHDVHLYESDNRPGGHANTVHLPPDERLGKKGVDVDTSVFHDLQILVSRLMVVFHCLSLVALYVFQSYIRSRKVLILCRQIVFNPSTYPNFLRFLQLFPPSPKKNPSRLQSLLRRSEDVFDPWTIPIIPTEMTFSISRNGGAFEWAGKNLATVFCQPHRVVDPQMWRMIYDILRFNTCARRVLLDVKGDNEREMSIGEYLDLEGYSSAFRNNYLIVSHPSYFKD